ncbi:MAG: N-6 DNA methylase, partial [Clostridia bacterium]|nr:N-6 DNA methylase [Clostridia bacterium]
MQKIKSFALYARSELEKQNVDPHTAKSGYIAMIINRYADIHGIGIHCDDSIIPQYIRQKFSADVTSADIFDVESLSWLYQYFVNIDRKNTVDAISGLETANRSIVAATQVFTPKWIVQYMIDNSLGRYWAEHRRNTSVTGQLPYYIHCDTSIKEKQLNPWEITVFDPCCGCGNILIYSFDVLMMMYREAGVSEAHAARSIVQCNLYGADIDIHAARIAKFAVMAKAFEYDKSIFDGSITPNIEVISNDGIGSLDYNISPHSVTARHFDIVCTNPPYLARMSRRLKDFTSRHIKPYSKDLFTAFMYRGLEYCTDEGYMAYMTPNVWMFLTSHNNIRHYILDNKHICTLLQLEKGSYFSEASVDICAFVIKNKKSDEPGIYINPHTGARTLDSQRSALLAAVNSLNSHTPCNDVYKRSAEHFSNIPERLVAYRTDSSVIQLFANPSIGDVYTVKQGMTTGNNKKFLRYWWQVPYSEIGFGCTDTADAAQSGKAWFPYNKGGKYRKWYGNNEY